ncbi:MAG: histidinol-phosphate transaminase [Tannerellaceae bacterium]|jgi:histidinol-phosphate aminotransferase|nr:histidinol-phosphate transaminase [Tannerellaceae bacterium]
MKQLKDLLRPNILSLKPYSSARDEFHGEASVFLDANENPYNAPYTRYPDPMQRELKRRLSELKDLAAEYIFIGNGSDEAIDLAIRAFCRPGIDNIVTLTPSYGMYEVAAQINQVACIQVPLSDNFRLSADAVLNATGEQTKIVYLCSPNNPTGNLLDREEIYRVLKYFGGIVVVDEAYIDFASSPSLTEGLVSFPRLMVLQTLSKAWGAAGIRLGMAFASPEIIAVLNKIKYPYNVSRPAQEYALKVLSREEEMRRQLSEILRERSLTEEALQRLPFVRHIYPSEANFILVRVNHANATYRYLVEQKVIVRNRHSVSLCEDCLRITIGTPQENHTLIKALEEMKP